MKAKMIWELCVFQNPERSKTVGKSGRMLGSLSIKVLNSGTLVNLLLHKQNPPELGFRPKQTPPFGLFGNIW